MSPRALAVSTWGQLAGLGILPPLMRMTDEASTTDFAAAPAAAPADEPGRADYLVRLRCGAGAQVTVPEPDPSEPASQIDELAADLNLRNVEDEHLSAPGNVGHCQ